MLTGQGITKHFGGLTALSGVDFELGAGEVVGLIGPNGSGKTTLFNVISGFHRPDEGQVRFQNQRIDRLMPHRIARLGLGRTFQIVRPLKDMDLTGNVAVAVLFGSRRVGSLRQARDEAREILDFCGLGRLWQRRPDELGLIDLKRLEVARALAGWPKVLLLDEAFAGLNRSEIEQAILLTERIRERFGVAIFMIEHVMRAIMGACTRIMVLHHGLKIAEGAPLEVAQDKAVIKAYLGEEAA